MISLALKQGRRLWGVGAGWGNQTRTSSQTTQSDVRHPPLLHHPIQTIEERASARLKILKALSGTNWGQQKETIVITCKALVLSILTYTASIWAPIASQDNLTRLQTIQNSALGIATGCHQRPRQHTCTMRQGYFQSKTASMSSAENIRRVPSALPIPRTQKLPKARASS